MHRLIAAVGAISCCVGSAQADVAHSAEARPRLTLKHALELAGAGSESLDAATAQVRAAQAGREEAGLRPNPTFSVEAENVAGSGPYKGVDSVELTASVSLPVELGGKRSARIGVADAEIRRATIQTLAADADRRLEVTQGYAEAVAAEKRLAVAQEQARIAEDILRVAEARVRAGKAPPIDVQRATILQINSEAQVQQLTRLRQVARFTLSQLVGEPAAMTLDEDWFVRIAPDVHSAPRIDSSETLSLAEAEADLAVADAQVRLARSNRVPDPTLSLGTRRFEETGDSAALAGISITLPLFNNGRAAVSRAVFERERADAQRRHAQRVADQAIAIAEAELANSAAAAATLRGPVTEAMEESARIARIGYREGKFEQLDLLDAEEALAQSQMAVIDALLGYHLARAKLERLTISASSEPGE